MDCGSYAVMPIPCTMALWWLLGTLVEGILGGLIVGAIVRDKAVSQRGLSVALRLPPKFC